MPIRPLNFNFHLPKSKINLPWAIGPASFLAMVLYFVFSRTSTFYADKFRQYQVSILWIYNLYFKILIFESSDLPYRDRVYTKYLCYVGDGHKYVGICGENHCTLQGLGPLHMSPVNRAGSVSKISPRHSFLCKNIDVFI